MAASLPSLNWLRVFEAAARCESFARAADELHMSAAAVSQQVRALEDRLGAPLFERHAHAVTLTEMGHAYLPGVQHALQTLHATTEGLFGTARTQQLFVRAVLLFAHGILTPGYAAFTDAHPNISLILTTGNDRFDFSRGFNDMQVIIGNPQTVGAEGDKLMEERLYPVATPRISAAITTASDLFQHKLIEVSTHRAGWSSVLDHAGVAAGNARYVFADNTLMAMALAKEGAGIALARAPASDKAMREAGLVRCLGEFSLPGAEAYHLIYTDRASLRPPARQFRDWLMGYCEGLG
ncbi:LysR family transcriptional regulator [Roseovarius sp. 2305UL8-3]|uniref:LysR family transcriptional regulator n=1 Tax=Roseovarius conchicola TaxID=3121636 RepID=UPI003528A629